MSLKRFIQTQTPKFHFMQKAMNGNPFTLLDLGAGNGSPSRTMAIFPNCTYHGLDLNYDYNYSPDDIKAIKQFYEMDLTKLEFDSIPDDTYDYINMAHIIEHLHNGDAVLDGMSAKLKKEGYIYIEYPGAKSKKLPSMPGSLNFHDDPTHVRLYSVKELSEVLRRNGFEIVSAGTRRSWFHVLVMPVRALGQLVTQRKVLGGVFWDLLGFAEYVFARKIK